MLSAAAVGTDLIFKCRYTFTRLSDNVTRFITEIFVGPVIERVSLNSALNSCVPEVEPNVIESADPYLVVAAASFMWAS